MIRFSILVSISFIAFFSFANSPKTSVEDYILQWKDVAIKQMESHKIPASIILAQAILESGSGNSLLAQKANNHFGIKCHDWNGKTFYKDDDQKDECFRKYKNAAQSFEDHSEFLTGRSRYAFLFALESNDYKGWAEGLKKAGYATNPAYAQRLINLIERYDLSQYDSKNQELIAKKPIAKPNNSIQVNAAVTSKSHEIFTNENQEKYVVAGEHDTVYLIAKELGLNLRQINKWNIFPAQQDVLKKGDKIYIAPRSKKSLKQNRES